MEKKKIKGSWWQASGRLWERKKVGGGRVEGGKGEGEKRKVGDTTFVWGVLGKEEIAGLEGSSQEKVKNDGAFHSHRGPRSEVI